MAEQQRQHGGARPRAGRKPKLEKYQTAIQKAELSITDNLPILLANLYHLANGGYERIEEEWQPAGLITIGSGENWKEAYPDKDPDELVLVKRKVSIADKDRAANIYLIDRVMGKPTQRQDIKLIKPPKPFEEMTDAELDEYITTSTEGFS